MSKKTVNKTDFIELLAASTGKSKAEAERMVEAFIEVITTELSKGSEIRLTGFGGFSVRTRKARTGVNPKTGQKIQIAASNSVGFSAGKTLKDAVALKK